MKKILSIIGIALSANSWAITNTQCVDNFVKIGNLEQGRHFYSFVASESIPYNTAFQKAYNFMVNDGLKVDESDSNSGIITGWQPVIGNFTAKTAIRVRVEKFSTGSKVNILFNPDKFLVDEEYVKSYFCKLLNASHT